MLIDSFNRKINYLRLSVTDLCNLKCIYCMPDNIRFIPHNDILRYEEITDIVKVLYELGIRKIRITGGEPLVKKNIDFLFNNLKSFDDLKLGITTNGIFLKKHLPTLIDSNFKYFNISLDSLNKDNYRKITGFNKLEEILENLKILTSYKDIIVKLNIVLIKGINDLEVFEFLKFSDNYKFEIRFIEEMPVRSNNKENEFISNQLIFEKINCKYQLIKINDSHTSMRYKIKNTNAIIGFISPHTEKFCGRCNRLRLSSDGMLRNCLLCSNKLNLKSLLRNNVSGNEIRSKIINFVKIKGKEHSMDNNNGKLYKIPMNRIGG